MSFNSFVFKRMCTKSDRKRDKDLIAPDSVHAAKDVAYKNGGKYNLLDVYYPKGTSGKLPVIVNIHGGGYVYGTKEVYFHYGMYLASQGFTVVNFNYHLAPKHRFPFQLKEINSVFEWIAGNADQYYMDLENVFVVGDSAGAQLNSQYAAIFTNPEYAAMFGISTPKEIKMKAVALNCGFYTFDFVNDASKKVKTDGIHMDYLGKKISEQTMKLLDVTGNITENYPPSFVMTSEYDFLKGNAEPMYNFLKGKGIDCEMKLYGKEGQTYMSHVFHVNMNLEEAKECNLDEIAFFRKYIS